ncbi:MAG: molybdopterin molybdotransferase MoeA [Salinivirgaceae bacterium]|nr:molybdopterin molybdotransferase MoeA [Salinivirgaceae bacterium]
MISFQEALNIVLDSPVETKIERILFYESLGRILAKDVVSDINMPPFNKSAMDGYAIKKEDIEKELTIIETIAAGQTPQKEIVTGTASKIMTGAPVPKGANAVVQVELAKATNNKVKFTGFFKDNIIPAAEDVKIGEVVLKKGQKIDARHIAVMASVGCTEPLVFKKPKVGIISTGDELVEPNTKPELSQIRNSNGHQLVAQVMESNAIAEYFGIVEDTYDSTYQAIKKGIETCDVLLLTGGVSMGEFDFVPQIMTDLGVEILFDRVAVQPGKPTTFGRKENKIIFGLPGNPVSSFVQFEILVKPLIYKMMGFHYKCPSLKLRMGNIFKRRKADRRAYIPVTISDDSKVYTSEYHGSAHIHALPKSNGLIIIEIGVETINEGELVDVRLF